MREKWAIWVDKAYQLRLKIIFQLSRQLHNTFLIKTWTIWISSFWPKKSCFSYCLDYIFNKRFIFGRKKLQLLYHKVSLRYDMKFFSTHYLFHFFTFIWSKSHTPIFGRWLASILTSFLPLTKFARKQSWIQYIVILFTLYKPVII